MANRRTRDALPWKILARGVGVATQKCGHLDCGMPGPHLGDAVELDQLLIEMYVGTNQNAQEQV